MSQTKPETAYVADSTVYERIEVIKPILQNAALAANKWNQDIEQHANSKNLSKQIFTNQAVAVGLNSSEILSIFDELQAKITKLTAAKIVKTGTSAGDEVLTAVVPETKK